MSFWDRVNQTLEGLVTTIEGQDSQFHLDVPVGQYDGAQTPDQARALLDEMGYVAPINDNPFAVNPADLFGTIVNATSPFTVIDLTPAIDGGTRGPITNSPSGTPTPNSFPAQTATIDKINTALNCKVLNLGITGEGLYPQGLTYMIQGAANSLRLERLPLGWIPNNVVNGAIQQLSSIVSTQLINNDVNAQSILNTVLSGCFVQFESTDNPVFIGKHAETYNLPFTKVFITTFGSAGRWRLIFGNKAMVTGQNDDRALRQNLHMWDGQGLFDSTSYHPTPFQINTGILPDLTTIPANTSYRQNLINNYDSGSKLSIQNSTNIVGQVSNKGYAILWITGINVSVAATTTNINDTIGIVIAKAFGNPNVAKTVFLTESYQPYFADNFNGTISKNYSFQAPIRVVLAGFDFNFGNPGDSGESLEISVANVTPNPASVRVSVYGYALGPTTFPGGSLNIPKVSLVPYNPYPGDVNLPVLVGTP